MNAVPVASAPMPESVAGTVNVLAQALAMQIILPAEGLRIAYRLGYECGACDAIKARIDELNRRAT